MNDDEFRRIHVAIIAGDTAAQQAFEAAVRPYALGIVTQRGLPIEDAEEIWNDALRVGLERAAKIKPIGKPLRAFVLSVAHAAAVDRVRARMRRKEVSLGVIETTTGVASIGPGDLKNSLSDAVVAAIKRCVATATRLHREAITMAANGLTAREIAQALGVTEANAAKIRQRARDWFRNCLGDAAL